MKCVAVQYRAYKAVDRHAMCIPADYKRKAANMDAAMGVPEEAAGRGALITLRCTAGSQTYVDV